MSFARLALALVACLTFALPGLAQQRISLGAPFDVGRLSTEERRVLQAAMALEGTYDALLDGAWGAGSRLALTRSTGTRSPTWGDVRELVRRYDEAHRRDGWRGVWHGDVAVWHLRPDALLSREDGPTETRFVSPGGGLVILSRRDSERPDALADAFAADVRFGTEPYRLTQEDRLAFAAQMMGGRHVYVRSDRAGSVWDTHVVLADEANRGRLQLIASSFARERRGDLSPADHPILGALLAGSLPRPPAPEPEPERDLGDTLATALETILRREIERATEDRSADAARREAERREAERLAREAEERAQRGAGRAIGFFVNTTDIVAPRSVTRACDRVRIQGGPELTEIQSRDGLVLMAAPGRSEAWLHVLGPQDLSDGDATVLATRGTSAEIRAVPARIRGGTRNERELSLRTRLDGVEMDGAPVLDRRTRVAGIWIDADETVGPRTIRDLLDRAGAPYVTRPDGRADLRDEVPDDVAGAVVRLRCVGG